MRYALMFLLFVICMPLSWYAAWDASQSFFVVGFSVILPTWGLAYWILVEVFGSVFGVGAGAFVLGMIGAFLSLSTFRLLDPKR